MPPLEHPVFWLLEITKHSGRVLLYMYAREEKNPSGAFPLLSHIIPSLKSNHQKNSSQIRFDSSSCFRTEMFAIRKNVSLLTPPASCWWRCEWADQQQSGTDCPMCTNSGQPSRPWKERMRRESGALRLTRWVKYRDSFSLYLLSFCYYHSNQVQNNYFFFKRRNFSARIFRLSPKKLHFIAIYTKKIHTLASPKVLSLDKAQKKPVLFCHVLTYSYLCTAFAKYAGA